MVRVSNCARGSALATVMAVLLGPLLLSQSPQATEVLPVCTPTEEAMQACVASGGKMNTLTCQCELPISKPTQPCAVVCPDGKIDPVTCACIKDN